MLESLRARLILWYAVVLAFMVVLYGGAVCYQSWRAMIQTLDTELEQRADEIAGALHHVRDGRFDLDLASEALEYFRPDGPGAYYVIWNGRGELVDLSDIDRAVRQPTTLGSRTELSRRELAVAADAGATVLVGRELTDVHTAIRSLALNVGLAGGATLALSVFGGWFIAGRALAPVARITHTARAMSSGDLSARIPVDRTETELEQLASTLNEAFDRLRLALDQQRRFTADASHELRTPVSVMRAELDWALSRARSADQYRDSLLTCRRAVLRIQDAIQGLLQMARVDAHDQVTAALSVAIGPLIEDIVTSLSPLADERQVSLAIRGTTFSVMGDPTLLREAVNNVIVNAIQYNRQGGNVSIDMSASHGIGRIRVSDTGIGIPASAMPYVFDRFYRVDPSRSRKGGGSGLGLSVARAAVHSHGGTIACAGQGGAGTVFDITLPLDSASHRRAG